MMTTHTRRLRVPSLAATFAHPLPHPRNDLGGEYFKLGQGRARRPEDERVEAQLDGPIAESVDPGVHVAAQLWTATPCANRANDIVDAAHSRRVAPGRDGGLVDQPLPGRNRRRP